MQSMDPIAHAADENFVVHATWSLRSLEAAFVHAAPDLVVADSGLPCDTYNFICRARLNSDTARERAAWAVRQFGGRPFSWWVGPADTPAELGDILCSGGLVSAESELAMAADLSLLPDIPRAAPGFEVRRVTTADALKQYAELSAANWTPPDLQVIRYFQLAAPALLSPDCPQRLYLGLLEGTPIATAEVTLSGEVAGVYSIATVEPYRRRGIGTMMTLAPLLEARRVGCRRAILQAAPDGVSIYRRLGFEAYGTITEYKPAWHS